MNLDHARTILNRVREGYPMSLAVTTQALQRTGDISDFPDKPLCFDGDEPCDDRAIEVESKGIEGGFSYSRYLDCPKTEGVKKP
jgi:hypothetical protein